MPGKALDAACAERRGREALGRSGLLWRGVPIECRGKEEDERRATDTLGNEKEEKGRVAEGGGGGGGGRMLEVCVPLGLARGEEPVTGDNAADEARVDAEDVALGPEVCVPLRVEAAVADKLDVTVAFIVADGDADTPVTQ